jgi:hypothetical protein
MASAVRTAMWWTRLRFNLGLLLDLSTWWIAGALCAVAVGIIVLKVAGGLWGIQPWHVLVSGAPVLIVPAVIAWVKRYDDKTVAAWLDLKGECGGRLIASAAQGRAIEDGTHPKVKARIRVLPPMGRLAIPAVLVVASFLVPWSVRSSVEDADAAINRKARVVEHRIGTARKMGIIDEDQARVLNERLDQARKNAGVSPEAAAEAVDQVQSKLDRNVLEAAENKRKGLLAAQALQDASQTGHMSGEDLEQALEQALGDRSDQQDLPPEIKEAMEKAASQQGGGQGGEAGNLDPSKMDPEALKNLGEMLENLNAQKLQDIGKASDLISGSQAQEMLAELTGGGDGAGDEPGQGEGTGDKPGAGGISRGRADADLGFTGESDASGVRFEPVPFDPADDILPTLIPGAKQSAGSTGAPSGFEPGGRSDFTADETEGGLSAGTPLSPFHDDVVSNFFGGGDK